MDLSYSAQETAFREEVRQFVKESLPAQTRDRVLGHRRVHREDYVGWHQILHRRGWGAPAWPREFGGTGWSPVQRMLFEIECARGGAPRLVPFGLAMIGPVLIKFASPAMQQRFLPRIPSMEDFWCQGYSEPGAGSDLASLKTRAERSGDHYVVNGQKTWTTMGHYADWMFCLVRTDPSAKVQKGISLLLVDMKTPGITVRPIVTLDGGREINEVWLEDVEVPAENLVGEENNGWTYAKYLLGHERTGIAGIGVCHRELKLLKELACGTPHAGASMLQEPRMRDKIARIEMEVLALEMLMLRVACESADKGPGPEASILKIRGSEIQQELLMLQVEVAGTQAVPFQPDWLELGQEPNIAAPQWAAPSTGSYMDMRKVSIYGGTTEVQKNIISKMILGM